MMVDEGLLDEKIASHQCYRNMGLGRAQVLSLPDVRVCRAIRFGPRSSGVSAYVTLATQLPIDRKGQVEPDE